MSPERLETVAGFLLLAAFIAGGVGKATNEGVWTVVMLGIGSPGLLLMWVARRRR